MCLGGVSVGLGWVLGLVENLLYLGVWCGGCVMRLGVLVEGVDYPDGFVVEVSGSRDLPRLGVYGVDGVYWGCISLFLTGVPFDHFVVHSIKGEVRGAGVVLYFAGLAWVRDVGCVRFGCSDVLGSDSSLNVSSVRVRGRLESLFGEFVEVLPHYDLGSLVVHDRSSGVDVPRGAGVGEVNLWRLVQDAPFGFEFRDVGY